MTINSLQRFPGVVKVRSGEPNTEQVSAPPSQRLDGAAARLHSEPQVE